jgi:hypothetical protein
MARNTALPGLRLIPLPPLRAIIAIFFSVFPCSRAQSGCAVLPESAILRMALSSCDAKYNRSATNNVTKWFPIVKPSQRRLPAGFMICVLQGGTSTTFITASITNQDGSAGAPRHRNPSSICSAIR